MRSSSEKKKKVRKRFQCLQYFTVLQFYVEKSVNRIANKDICLIGMSNSHAINGGNHSASLLISSSSSSSSSSATSPCRLTPEVGWNNQVDMSERERERERENPTEVAWRLICLLGL
jgi:hypothetical protein